MSEAGALSHIGRFLRKHADWKRAAAPLIRNFAIPTMSKRSIRILIVACSVCWLPILGFLAFVWYGDVQESRNDFTLAQVCSMKAGQKIDDALQKLGNPVEYHTYNFSNVYSGQYRNPKRGYFVEIYYTTDKGIVEKIFWGRGRTQTLAQSGVCSVR